MVRPLSTISDRSVRAVVSRGRDENAVEPNLARTNIPRFLGGPRRLSIWVVCAVPDVAELMDWLRRNLGKEHTIATLAARMHVSERTLARRFHEQAGTTPMRWLASERVGYAQQLLETTDLSVEQISVECGFGSAQLLRFHFQRITATSPTSYRTSFAGYPDSITHDIEV